MTMATEKKRRGGGAHRAGQPAMEMIQRIGDEKRERELREAVTEVIPVIDDFRIDRHVVEALDDRYVAWALDAQMDHEPCGFCSLIGHEVDFRVWGEDVQQVCRECLPHAIARDWTEHQVQIEYSPRMAELMERMTGHGHRISGVLDETEEVPGGEGEPASVAAEAADTDQARHAAEAAASVELVLPEGMRLCIDEDCPSCGWAERWLDPNAPGGQQFGCNKCHYRSGARDE